MRESIGVVYSWFGWWYLKKYTGYILLIVSMLSNTENTEHSIYIFSLLSTDLASIQFRIPPHDLLACF